MSDTHVTSHAKIIPTLRYQDGRAAIDWLCKAFGFVEQLVVLDPSGSVAHAQLTYANGMIMLGSANNNEFSKLVKSPFESGALGSQSVYIVVEDVDAHHAKSVAAGGETVIALMDEDYGGRVYSCRDPEGHVWSFGSYDPWAKIAPSSGNS
jgi:uncharacterized glyoxalase superfamily protein PhnB